MVDNPYCYIIRIMEWKLINIFGRYVVWLELVYSNIYESKYICPFLSKKDKTPQRYISRRD